MIEIFKKKMETLKYRWKMKSDCRHLPKVDEMHKNGVEEKALKFTGSNHTKEEIQLRFMNFEK